MKALTFKGGVHPLHKQHEGKDATKALPIREVIASTVIIPMVQNLGAACAPCVAAGDDVLLGQKIGEPKGFVSAPIHASVSGKVVAVEPRPHVSGVDIMSVVIENDGRDSLHESVRPRGDIETLTPDEIKKIVLEAGIVGMGGATFPSHVKLAVKEGTVIDTLIINGAECEPYLTTDHRLMLEKAHQIVYGARALRKATGAPKVVIAIENNKPDALENMTNAASAFKEVIVQPLVTKYPQGGEKQLINAVTGREVPMGALPSAVGVLVFNIATTFAVADAITTGMPLVKRVVTVTGDVITPANLLLRVGTTFQDAIDACDGYKGVPSKILSGGPMMGFSVYNPIVAVTKGTSGITVFNETRVKQTPAEGNCIRCGRCVYACPMGLVPQQLNAAFVKDRLDLCEQLNIMNCINCGSCSYICPAKRHLTQSIVLGKKALQKQAALQKQQGK